ncbi:MAG: hypothetical protein LBQ20_01130 [Rhodanobacter sp.]|jgi:hypothetical protein|nr:hypothetical protein [Rhodanobacter sp.]
MALLASALGALLVLAGIVAAIVGSVFVVFVPQLIVGGLLLLIGLVIERWRYKPIVHRPPERDWTDTGERFIDPETNKQIAVYLDAMNGERHYIAIDR